MTTVWLHLFGNEANACAMVSLLRRLDGVKRVEEVPDPWRANHDDASADDALVDDQDRQVIEIELRDRLAAARALEYIEEAAVQLAVPLEFVVES